MVGDVLLSLFEQYWQGVVGILALLVAFYAMRAARRTFRMEYETREVRIDLVAEEMRLSEGNKGQNWEVQVFNDTGTSQSMRDLWICIVDYPSDISDGQAERLATVMQAFADATHGLMARPDVYQSIRGVSRTPEFARHWFPRLAARILNVYDRVVKGKGEITGAERYMLFVLNRLLVDLASVSSALTMPSRLDFGRYLFWRGLADNFRKHEEFLLLKTANITIPPRDVRSVRVDLQSLYTAFEKSLWMLGGEFAILCQLEARVSGAPYRSESDLIDVTLSLPVLDLTPLVEQIRKQAFEMKWPPTTGSSSV